MSSSAGNNSGRQKIHQLLASIGSKSAQESTKLDAVEYNWRQPHYFSSEQLGKLESFTAKLAQSCSEKFTELYHGSFNVTVVSTTQHFAGEFTVPDNIKNDYYLAFGLDDNQLFGFVGVPIKTAVSWAEQLLGDTSSENNSDKDLSELEKSLLLDISNRLVGAFSSSCEYHNMYSFDKLVKGELPAALQGDKELCKVALRFEQTGSGNSAEAYFLIFCKKLEDVVGQKQQTTDSVSAKDPAKVILDQLHKVPVNITAQLACTQLTFEQVTNLGVEDVLLLDKKINTPVELIVDSKTFFKGMLAKSDGRQAVIITERCVGK